MGKKYPKNFMVRVLKLAADGSLEWDVDCNVIFEEEHWELACYHIAHQELWKKKFEKESKLAAVSVEAEYTKVENKEGNSKSDKRKRKHGNKNGD